MEITDKNFTYTTILLRFTTKSIIRLNKFLILRITNKLADYGCLFYLRYLKSYSENKLMGKQIITYIMFCISMGLFAYSPINYSFIVPTVNNISSKGVTINKTSSTINRFHKNLLYKNKPNSKPKK